MASNRERFFALVQHKEPVVLSWFMSFFNEHVARRLLGSDSVPADVVPARDLRFGASDRADWDAKVRYARATGNCAQGVGWGACIPFGHGGPGEFRDRLLEEGDKQRISIYETGVKKQVRRDPHFYQHYDYPVLRRSDWERMVLPDPDDPARYAGLAEEIAYYKQHDLVAYGNLNGFFSGIHYFLYPYDRLLADLILDPGFVLEMLARLGDWNLRAAKQMLRRGVDVIAFCDDLGSGKSLLMSPALYRRFFRPWHERLTALCHRYGATLHMHSHGNINQVVGDLAEIGIDLLNPLDPAEGMDLPALKRQYGRRMTFVGGLDKFFFGWEFARQEAFVRRLVQETGGGFILMDSGGVPEDCTPDQFRRLRDLLEEVKNL
jgi:uroporphyrinogen decarboxylase